MGVRINQARHQRSAAHIDNRDPRAIDRDRRNRMYVIVFDEHVNRRLQFGPPIEDEIGIGKKNIGHRLPIEGQLQFERINAPASASARRPAATSW